MNFRNYMKIEFTSLPENVSFSRVVVATFASQLDFTLDDLEEIKVAISEAVSNAIIHGYQNQPDGLIYIESWLGENWLEVVIKDNGVGIANINQAMQPAYTTCSDRMGLGFSFMQSFMDKVEVKSLINKGTILRLLKKVKHKQVDIDVAAVEN